MDVLSRLEALTYREEAIGYGPPNWSIKPVDAAMGGCPWRITIINIIRASAYGEARVFAAAKSFLDKYDDPETLNKAAFQDLVVLLQPIPLMHRAVRQVKRFTACWLSEEWETMLDLKGISLSALQAIEKYVIQPHRASDAE